MSILKALFSVLCVGLVVGGCDANFHSIYRTTPNGTGAPHSQVVVTDAKQGVSVMNYDKDTETFRVCAARSPDVFSALSTAFQGSASGEAFQKFAVAISGSGTSAELAGAFGLRTQLTQSQMELLYQLCLEAMNDKLTPDQLATEIHRYQNTMVTMLAIEQVTGYARPTIVALGGQSAAGNADALAKQQTYTDLQIATEDTLKSTAADSAGASAKKKTATADALKAKEAADGEVTTANNAVKDANAKLDEAKKKTPPVQTEIDAAQKVVDEKTKLADAAGGKAKLAGDAVDKAKKEESDASTQADKDSTALDHQTKKRDLAEKTLKAMEKQVDISSASNPAQVFEPAAVPSYADPETAKAISNAVVTLQQTHLNQTFLMDECVRYVYHPESVLSDRSTAIQKTLGAKNSDALAAEMKAFNNVGATGSVTDKDRFQECRKHFASVDQYRQSVVDAYMGCVTTTVNTPLLDAAKNPMLDEAGQPIFTTEAKRECKLDASKWPSGVPAPAIAAPAAASPYQ